MPSAACIDEFLISVDLNLMCNERTAQPLEIDSPSNSTVKIVTLIGEILGDVPVCKVEEVFIGQSKKKMIMKKQKLPHIFSGVVATIAVAACVCMVLITLGTCFNSNGGVKEPVSACGRTSCMFLCVDFARGDICLFKNDFIALFDIWNVSTTGEIWLLLVLCVALYTISAEYAHVNHHGHSSR